MEWEGKQLSSLNFGNNTISYAYDENGLRTQKTVNGTTTNYHYNGSVLIGMTNSGNRSDSFRFSYDSNGNVVSISWDMPRTYNPSGTAYYLRNAQGDIVGLLDEQGNKVIDYTYDSWGKDISPLPRDQAYIDLQHFQPFRYRGYIYDNETDWYYLQSRYYDPTVGRFISSDVMLSTGQGVLGHNSYAYCLNNPVNMRDPKGYDAVVLVDTDSLSHIGIMAQDENGQWWHFYWGASDGRSSSWGQIWTIFSINYEPKTWCLEYEGDISPEAINAAGQFLGDYEYLIYLEGSFIECVDSMKNPTGLYNLYSNNCSQYSLRLLMSGPERYRSILEKASKKTIPRDAGAYLERLLCEL